MNSNERITLSHKSPHRKMHKDNLRQIQQDQYAVNRAFHAYQDAVAEWSRASVELDKAHDRMEQAAKVLRTFMENK